MEPRSYLSRSTVRDILISSLFRIPAPNIFFSFATCVAHFPKIIRCCRMRMHFLRFLQLSRARMDLSNVLNVGNPCSFRAIINIGCRLSVVQFACTFGRCKSHGSFLTAADRALLQILDATASGFVAHFCASAATGVSRQRGNVLGAFSSVYTVIQRVPRFNKLTVRSLSNGVR